MACGAWSYESLTLRAPLWCFVFFVVSLARERAGRNFPRSRRPQSRLAVLVEEKAWMVSFRPTMTGLISPASPEAIILTGCLRIPKVPGRSETAQDPATISGDDAQHDR